MAAWHTLVQMATEPRIATGGYTIPTLEITIRWCAVIVYARISPRVGATNMMVGSSLGACEPTLSSAASSSSCPSPQPLFSATKQTCVRRMVFERVAGG